MDEILDKWREEAGEIPPNTCLAIDTAIKSVQNIIDEIVWLEKNAHRYDTALDIVKDFPSLGWNDNPISDMEELRTQNEQLRNLGIYWYEKTKEVLLELHSLKEWNKIHGFNK